VILTSQLVQQRRGDGNVRLGEAGHLAGPRVHRLPPAQDERLLLPRAHEAAQLLCELFPFGEDVHRNGLAAGYRIQTE